MINQRLIDSNALIVALDDCDTLTPKVMQIVNNSPTIDVGNKQGCAWCKAEYTIIDDDFGQPLHPNYVKYCFYCGKKIEENNGGKNHNG